ncbi:MAG: 3-oxoacyl-ACP synthase III family protein [Sulfurifustis sp.]
MSKVHVPVVNNVAARRSENPDEIEKAAGLLSDPQPEATFSENRVSRMPRRTGDAERAVMRLESDVRLLREEATPLQPSPQILDVNRLALGKRHDRFFYTVCHSRLVSTGVYVPEQRVTSTELFESFDSKNRFDIPYDWLERSMGIRERRMAPADVSPSQMALTAAREALDRAAIPPPEIDVIVYAGIMRDYVEPASAHIVQDRLQAKNAIVFDVTNACHGFMNAIHLVDALIGLRQARYGLIVTGEHLSRVVRRAVETLQMTHDRKVFKNLAGGLTLGDAGAAIILGPKLTPESGFMGCMLRSMGEHSGLCTYGARGEESAPLMTDMPNIVKAHLQMHAEMYRESMLKFGWEPDEISKFVHHQVSLRAFKMHSEYSKVPVGLMPNTVSTMGNLATASIPVNLHNLVVNRELADGDKVFIAGAGSGLSISQAAFVWEQTA